ncbi:MAG: zincin-like metallopeptidase domain-containing protein [Blautia faecis]
MLHLVLKFTAKKNWLQSLAKLAFLINHLGIETEGTFQNSASYIESWLKVLKNDNKFIISASSKAEKAVNYILGIE